MQQIDGIIFDVDGTLVQSNRLILDSFNFILNKYLNETWSDKKIFSYFGPTEDVLIEQIFATDHLAVKEDYYQYYQSNHSKLVSTYPLIDEIIKYIKKHDVPLSIFTGKGRRSTEITLTEVGLINCFDLIVTGDDIEGSKPSREGVDMFIDKFNLNRENVIIIGDAPPDHYAAKNSGIKGASALWDSYKKEEMLRLGNDFEFHTSEDLFDFLKEKLPLTRE